MKVYKRFIPVLILLTILLTISSFASADTIIFKSGDKLTGEIKNLIDGKVAFNAAEVGEVSLDINRIQEINVDKPVEFHLTDGTIIKSTAKSTKPGRLTLEKTDMLNSQDVALSDITAINPPAEVPPKWTGNVTAGISSTHGNTFAEGANASFNAQRRTEKTRTNLDALYLVSRTKEKNSAGKEERTTTEESLSVKGKYDYFFTKKFYGFVNTGFKKDHIADLDRRLIGGLGVGYQWIESKSMNFSTDAGLAELCEQYTTRNPLTYELETAKSDDMSLQLGYHFDWNFNDKILFIHNTRYYPSFEMLSDYFLTTDAELRANFTKSMFASFKALMDYDSTPAENSGTTDTKYILGLGWNF